MIRKTTVLERVLPTFVFRFVVNVTWRYWNSPRFCCEWYFVVYYESRNRKIKKRRKNEDRCDERLKTIPEESTYLVFTGVYEELEHLKIKTRLIRTRFPNVMGEYVIYVGVYIFVYRETRKREVKTRPVKFISNRIKKRRNPRVKIVTPKLCGVWKSRYSLYEKQSTCAATQCRYCLFIINRESKSWRLVCLLWIDEAKANIKPIYECRCNERL
jgi:hypothetical protein